MNREKTQIADIRDVRFLGYGFYIHRGKGRLRSEGGRDTGPASVAMGKYKGRIPAYRRQLDINPCDAE